MGPSLNDLLGVIDRYTYKPQYTGDTEKGLYDLFGKLTGESGGGAGAIPFDLGNPTSGLYDSLTRGIKESYLGTPGGPEGGRIADMRAYYNNMGIPEQAINQERLANKDLNNSLLDSAAQVNNTQKDRLTNILGLGTGVGQNLYNINTRTQNANAGLGVQAAGIDVNLQDQIRQANQQSLNDLLSGGLALGGTALATSYGGPAAGTAANYGINNLINPNAPTAVNKTGGTAVNPFSSGTSTAKLI